MLFGCSCCHELVFLMGFVESPKESRLPVVASYSVVKEPTSVERAARLPDPSVRVKRNVSDAGPLRPRETIPVDPDTLPLALCCWKDRRLPKTAGTVDSRSRSRPCQLRRAGNLDNQPPSVRIPSFAAAAPFAPAWQLQRK